MTLPMVLRSVGRHRKSAILGGCLLLLMGATTGLAQAPMPGMPAHAQNPKSVAVDQNQQMIDQIVELRAQVAKLQAAAPSAETSKKPMGMPGMGMGAGKGMPMMGDKAGTGGGMGAMPPSKKPMSAGKPMPMMGHEGEMGAMPANASMQDDQGEMGGMPSAASPAAAMGMCCMGGMGGMSGDKGAAQPAGGMAGMSGPSSAMPAQPGASHLYHIGSTGFFLNHPQHITLSQDQRMALNRLKEKAMLERASVQRRIDQGEQELYTLTGADQPDSSTIQAKVSEIEKLRGDQRMSFIRAVGEATNVLTHDQHLALMGTMAAASKK